MEISYRESKYQIQIINYGQIDKLFKLLSDEFIISCEIDSDQLLVLSLMIEMINERILGK